MGNKKEYLERRVEALNELLDFYRDKANDIESLLVELYADLKEEINKEGKDYE